MLLLLTLCTVAFAHERAPYDHKVSLTVSPIHLTIPVLELTGEARVHDRVGVAAVAGAGATTGVTVWELGAQGRYYPVGDFDHGMQLGAEVLGVGGGDDGDTAVGAALGPFLGYKIAARFGLTFEGQLGVQYATVRANGGDSDAGVAPLLNLNLGWSF